MHRREMFDRFCERVASGAPIFGITSAMASPVATEIHGHAGADFVIIDNESVALNPERLEELVRAAECADTIAFVKVESNDKLPIAAALNSGAPIVGVPHVCNGADLQKAVDGAFYPPVGKRGLCSVSRANRYGVGKMSELVEWTNSKAWLVPIVEDVEALDNLDDIVSHDSVQLIEYGPVDMSRSMGLPPDAGLANGAVAEGMYKLVEVAKKYGKQVMSVPIHPEITTENEGAWIQENLVGKGVNVVFFRPDSLLLGAVSRRIMSLKG